MSWKELFYVNSRKTSDGITTRYSLSIGCFLFVAAIALLIVLLIVIL